MEKYQEIERSIIKTYRKTIWRKFTKAINDYQLIQENDKIMVCISGGKDSFLLAKCIQELLRHGKIKFSAEFVVMNPGYNSTNNEKIIENAKILNIDIKIFETDIFNVVEKIESKSPCYLCARMRRGHLYNKAKELGCNKIALGHHFDDVIETILLSMMYGSEIKTMMPKLHSENFEGLELIRPLYLVKEQDIINFQNGNDLSFINCACPLTVNNQQEDDSKRKEMKELVKQLRKNHSAIDDNIFKSISNININAILGYRLNGEMHSFLDNYDNIKEE